MAGEASIRQGQKASARTTSSRTSGDGDLIKSKHVHGSIRRAVLETLEHRLLLTSSVWNNVSDAMPTWTSASNWSPSTSYPATASDSASFAVNITANQTIGLGANLSVNALTVGDTTTTGGSGQSQMIASNHTLYLDNGNGFAAITLGDGAVGAATLDLPIVANSEVSIVNNSNQPLIFTKPIEMNGHDLFVGGSGKIVFAGVISNSGSGARLVEVGTGTVQLAAANTFDSGIWVASGTLQMAPGGTIGGPDGYFYMSGGTFDLNGVNTTVTNMGTEVGASILNNAVGTNATLIVNDTAGFSGTITDHSSGSGTVSIEAAGAGKVGVILSGTNTYTGTTKTDAGASLWINGTDGTPGSGNIINNGVLYISRTTDFTIPNIISGSGIVVKLSSGVTTFSGANTYTGQTSLGGGTLRLAGNGTLGDPNNTLAISGGTLDLNGHNLIIYNPSIYAGSTILNNASGTRSTITVTGPGEIKGLIEDHSTGTGTIALSLIANASVSLWAANTYSGGTTIAPGTYLGAVDAGGSMGSGDVIDNGMLFPSGLTDQTIPNAISGSGIVNQLSSHVVTLAGNNTYFGGTDVNLGTLRLGPTGTLGSSAVPLILFSGTLDLYGTTQTVGSVNDYPSTTLINNASNSTSKLRVIGGSSYFPGTVVSPSPSGGIALLSYLPSVQTQASATVSADGKSINLSSLGTSAAGESGLTYTWQATSIPAGGATPTYSANGTNAAKSTAAALSAAGMDSFRVTITNPAGDSTTSDIGVLVGQTVSTISLSPTVAAAGAQQTQLFTATCTDQFGQSIPHPILNWSATTSTGSTQNAGTIDPFGLYTAPANNIGTFTITASSGGVSAAATAVVGLATPTLFGAESSDRNAINLAWSFPPSSQNNDDGFDVIRNDTTTNTTLVRYVTDPTLTSFIDTAVIPGHTYSYSLKPYKMVNGTKVFGSASASVTVWMRGVLTLTPSTAPIAATTGTAVTITLPFTDTDTTDSHVATIDWGDGTSGNPDTAPMTVTEPANGHPGTITATHTYTTAGNFTPTIQATSSDGSQATASVSLTINVPTPPVAPTAIGMSSESQDGVTITWQYGSPNPEEFDIEWSDDQSDWYVIDTTDGTARSWTDENPVYNSSNYYRVMASDGVLNSTPTGSTPVAMAITAPTPLDDANNGPNDRGTLAGLTVQHDRSLTIQTSRLIGNDQEWDGLPASIVSLSTATDGSITDNHDGTLTFTPNAHFAGESSFTYTASNGVHTSEETEVAIDVLNKTPAPQSQQLIYQMENAIGTVTFEGNTYPNGLLGQLQATDDDSDNVIYAVSRQPTDGTLHLDTQTGAFVYVPSGTFPGADSFDFTASDGVTADGPPSDATDMETGTSSPTLVTITGNLQLTDNPVIYQSRDGVNEVQGLFPGLPVQFQDLPGNGSIILTKDSGDSDTPVLTVAQAGVWYTGYNGYYEQPTAGYEGTDTFSLRYEYGIFPGKLIEMQPAFGDAYSNVFVSVNPAGQFTPVGVANDRPTTVSNELILMPNVTMTLQHQADHGTVTLFDNGTFIYTPRSVNQSDGSTSPYHGWDYFSVGLNIPGFSGMLYWVQLNVEDFQPSMAESTPSEPTITSNAGGLNGVKENTDDAVHKLATVLHDLTAIGHTVDQIKQSPAGTSADQIDSLIDTAAAERDVAERDYQAYSDVRNATLSGMGDFLAGWWGWDKDEVGALAARINRLPVDVGGLHADRDLLKKYQDALRDYGAGAGFAVSNTTLVVNLAKETHDAAETAIQIGGLTSIALTGAEVLTEEGCAAFVEYSARQIENTAQAVALSYVSQNAISLAQAAGFSIDPEYLQIGADAFQLVSLWQAAKAERNAAGSNCFVAGTEVATDRTNGVFSDEPIQDLKIGDTVLSRDQNDPAAPVEHKTVTDVFEHTVYDLRDVQIENTSTGAVQTIQVTPSHPFYVEGTGWTEASALTACERLESPDGSSLTVTGNADDPRPAGVAVYNFTVADDHTYFVSAGGDDFAWVHNDCGFRAEVLKEWESLIKKPILPGQIEAHHIVPENFTSPQADELREILTQFNIDINDPVNGVPLPTKFHQGDVHWENNDYVDAVYERLKNCGSQAELKTGLREIGFDLFNGHLWWEPS